MDPSWPNHQKGIPQTAVPVGAFRQGAATDRGIISGDNLQFGKLRRPARVSQSEGSGPEEDWLSSSPMASGSYGQSPGLHSEASWGHRGSYEQAESTHFQRFPSSPRSPNTRGGLTFHSRRGQDHGITTVRASGTPHRQSTRGRHRTSSETEQGGKGSRGPQPRKRGLSETEGRSRWEKYDSFRKGSGRALMCV